MPETHELALETLRYLVGDLELRVGLRQNWYVCLRTPQHGLVPVYKAGAIGREGEEECKEWLRQLKYH